MSDLHRAEMAESKLRAIRSFAKTLPAHLAVGIIAVIDAEVWDGYQTLHGTHSPNVAMRDHKEP